MDDQRRDLGQLSHEQNSLLFSDEVIARVVELVGDVKKSNELLERCSKSGVDPLPLAKQYRKKRGN